MRTRTALKAMRAAVDDLDRQLLDVRNAYNGLSRKETEQPAAKILERLVHGTSSDIGVLGECVSILEERLK